jgi:hypothetical protein
MHGIERAAKYGQSHANAAGDTMALVTFWLNAFIPRNVPGYTQEIRKGAHAGKTAVPLPKPARLWPGNMFKQLNTGYLTDQRTFDASPAASARMQCLAAVDLSSLTLTKSLYNTSGTTQVNIETGEETGFKKADMTRCKFEVALPKGSAPPKPAPSAGWKPPHAKPGYSDEVLRRFKYPAEKLPAGNVGMSVRLVAAAGDPLVGMAADIDYEGLFTISSDAARGVVEVAFRGMLDAFPAYDCYASYEGHTKALFTANPPPGNTVMDLLGLPNRRVNGSVQFP